MRVLSSGKLHSDDTSLPVLQKGNVKSGRLWVYLANEREKPALCLYEYSPNRSKTYPEQLLKEYSGYLQADACPGYNGLYESGKIIEVACFAHCRRKFFEITKKVAAPSLAHDALALIGKLYEVEAACKAMSITQRYYYRKKWAKPWLKRLKQWLRNHSRRVVPGTPLSGAIHYALNHWQAFCNYLRHGDLHIDNNAAEHQIKPCVIGRKNYLFAGSDHGAKHAATIYSIIETCKLNSINTFNYLADVFKRIPNLKANQLDLLLPFNWQPQQ